MLLVDSLNFFLENKVFEKAWNREIREDYKIPHTIIFYEHHKRCDIFKFLKEMKEKILKAKILKQLCELKKGKHLGNYLTSGIFKLETEKGNFLYFYYGSLIVISHVVENIDKKDIKKVIKRQKKFSKLTF